MSLAITSDLSRALVLAIAVACWGGCGGNDETESVGEDGAPATTVRQTETLLPAPATVPDTSDIGLPTRQLREAGKVYPVDEGPQDAGFVAFRQNLLDAVERRDASAIRAIVAEDIRYSFGADGAREGFLEEWGGDVPGGIGEALYRELGDVLRGGGVWQDAPGGGRLFHAPYTSSAVDVEDPYTTGVITGEGVNVRSAPSTQGRILAQLSYETVPLPQGVTTDGATVTLDGRDYGWTPVELPGGQTGYVVDKYLRRPIGYRAWFEKLDGRWMMTSFIAGD